CSVTAFYSAFTVTFIFFFSCYATHLYPPSFPTRRSSDLVDHEVVGRIESGGGASAQTFKITTAHIDRSLVEQGVLSEDQVAERQDRKSTRLNSSHVSISYAVFCLKKKSKQRRTLTVHD